MKHTGECRRYPKYWPKEQKDWCGEFRGREADKQADIDKMARIWSCKDRSTLDAKQKQAVDDLAKRVVDSVPEHAEPYVTNEWANKALEEAGFKIDNKGIVRKE